MRQVLKSIGSYITADWYEKLRFIFIAIILTNTISIFEGYWWDETYEIAYYTLFAAAAIDVLLPLRFRYLNLVLKICTAIFITTQLARMDWLVASPQRWDEWIWWLQAHVVQLNPYIWISAALLLLHILFGIWTTTRIRMFGFVGVSILVLTIADSFTPIWLWDEVGMVVFIGLLWLVASHMSRLKREHPNSWKELIEYPLQLILPIALVLSVLMIVGLNMPSLSPILQDPYTIWKESKGEKVEVFLGDKGADSVTPGSTASASSGYSRNDQKLGGGFEYDYSPMMTVTTSHRSYWRGESKNFYTGEGWVNAEVGQSERGVTGVQKGQVLSSLDEPPVAGTLEINQIVTMIRKDTYPVLFAAAPLTKVNWINDDQKEIPTGYIWVPDTNELRLLNWSMKNRIYPKTYSVTSSVPVLDEELLKKAKAGWTNKAEAASNRYYLQVPDTLPDRVKQLAMDVTAEATNDYDKAKLLETYLRLNYNYNNKPDETKLTGSTSDFVDQFLFELKEGYCDYFSTSMAVMARSLGLPTRWVKGFAPGALPASDFGPPTEFREDVNPSGAGTYMVRNSDAHSWVEIYFEGFGWIPFEATAGFSFPYSFAEEEKEVLPEIDTDTEASTESVQSASKSNARIWTWSAVALLAVVAAVWLFVRRTKVIVFFRKLRHGSYTSNDRIVLETQKLLRVCKKRGMEREDHETLREAVMRWSQSQKRLRDDFKTVLDRFEQAKYSPIMATNEEADRFVLKVKSLIDQLR
ncbi:transglutaminase TgpA family protein [Paenibacillus sp. FJAT-27812]|uniref:transglutaminase TgpA family protein n=1 Tax=Paenibacillus sp. FJAT-27812 TaxID=1684143 RepID=UPI0006A76798|nr:transglutaminase domain-containing protein [Paenibacillus sp. FJAT-27812]